MTTALGITLSAGVVGLCITCYSLTRTVESLRGLLQRLVGVTEVLEQRVWLLEERLDREHL